MPKEKKRVAGSGDRGGGAPPVVTDSRFAIAHTAPNFKRMQKDKHKVTLDERFSAVLTDERFSLPDSKYDKYGRKQTTKKSAKDALSAFYTLEEGGDNDDKDDVPESDDNVDYDELYAAEAALEEGKEKSEASKTRGLKPKPKVIKRQKLKPGETLPQSEMKHRLAHLNRMARGELESGDDSDSDSSDSSNDSDAEGSDNGGGEASVWSAVEGPPQTAELPSGGETRRLAVCNLDWDHLAAVDVFKLMESFVPAGGAVLKVAVYPSNYGLEKLAHEARYGPKLWREDDNDGSNGDGQGQNEEDDGEGDDTGSDVDEDSDASGDRLGKLDGGDGGKRKQVGIVFASGGSDSEDLEDGDFEGLPAPQIGTRSKGSRVQVAVGYGKTQDFDEDMLRRYELQRAKYYFALVELDSVATAAALYDRVDGMEWEHSSTTVDLSFVPDGEDILAGREPRDEALAAPNEYDAPQFVTKAKQQSKVTCTWDEDDPGRARALSRLQRLGVQTASNDEDVRGVLALSSDDDDDDDDSGSDEEEESGSEEEDEHKGSGGAHQKKGKSKKNSKDSAAMRKMMGLDGDSDDGSDGSDLEDDAFFTEAGGDDNNSDSDNNYFIEPSAKEDALRSALAAKKAQKNSHATEETPWEKTQRKLAEKKAAHKAARKARLLSGGRTEEAAAVDQESDEEGKVRNATDAEFFVQDGANDDDDDDFSNNEADDAEDARNYDMRAIERHEKLAGKKLKGARARKEAKRAAAASGLDGSQASFEVNVADPRFAALLDGSDERFGLDPTSANFKATKGMDAVLKEQRRRRQAASEHRENSAGDETGTNGTSKGNDGSSNGSNVSSGGNEARNSEANGSGSASASSGDLSSLVNSLKRRALPDTGKSKSKSKKTKSR